MNNVRHKDELQSRWQSSRRGDYWQECKRGDGGVRLLIDEEDYDEDEWVER